LNRKYVAIIAVVLIVIIIVSFLIVARPASQPNSKPFYVGVEFAFGTQSSQVKALVNEVKNYTNLFVMGSAKLTFNRTALNESCDYIYNSGLNFIVLITSFPMYNASNGYPGGNTIFDWMGNASLRYGKQLLGFYRFDEPGGNQIDKGKFQLVKNASLSKAEVATQYVDNLGGLIKYYASYGNRTTATPAKMFTSDYALYWYDYQSDYTTVFGEFVGNESRQPVIALNRGAADSFRKPWGVIVTWNSEFLQPENKVQLLTDLQRAHDAGATYAVVFPFDIAGYSYWTLPQEDFDALREFWGELNSNQSQFMVTTSHEAYVVPNDFGFGFRSATDSIWGLFPASSDPYTAKICSDTQILLDKYGAGLNIIYDNQTIIASTLKQYSRVYYYNQALT